MSFDLLVDQTERRQASLRPVSVPETGVFDNFVAGTVDYTMQGFAKAARAGSLAAGAVITAPDRVTGGTEIQDRYFRFHDAVFGNAVDHWTPKPSETGVAAEMAGALLSTLPLVIANPAAAVAATQLSVGEDLVRKGVSPGKAGAVGAVQGAGLGLGVWLPVLGANGWQRIVVGGMGANIAQGVASRGASAAILDGTPAADDFKAFDPSAITLDALLGAAFGGVAHISPAQRASGERAWERIREWGKALSPSEVDALAVLRQAQHLNVDSAAGKLTTPQDIDAHVARARRALEQVARDEPVAVDDLPEPRVEADKARVRQAERVTDAMTKEADRTAKELDIETAPAPVEAAAPAPVEHTPQRVAEALAAHGVEATDDNIAKVRLIAQARAVDASAVDALPERMPDGEYMARIREIANAKQGAQATTEGGAQPRGTGARAAGSEARPAAREGAEAAGGQRGEAQPGGEGAGQVDPLSIEAERFATEHPDLPIVIGRDADGKPITTTAAQLLAESRQVHADATEAARLVEEAAACMLGVA